MPTPHGRCHTGIGQQLQPHRGCLPSERAARRNLRLRHLRRMHPSWTGAACQGPVAGCLFGWGPRLLLLLLLLLLLSPLL